MKFGWIFLTLFLGMAPAAQAAGGASPRTVMVSPGERKTVFVPGMGTWRPLPPVMKPRLLPRRWAPVGPTALWRAL